MKDDERLEVEGPFSKDDVDESILRKQNIEDDDLYFKIIFRKQHPYNPDHFFVVAVYVPCWEIYDVHDYQTRIQGLLNQNMAQEIKIAETKEYWVRIRNLIDRLDERNKSRGSHQFI